MPNALPRITVFLSAFLLFLIEPIAAKQILPALGGSSAVWLTCLVLFQLMLLFGYLWAHALTHRLGPDKSALLHLGLVGAAVISRTPLVPHASLTAASQHPIGAIFLYLGSTIGLPFLLLASTGPLIQVWIARRQSTGIPFRLFGLSNTGSLLALLLYPTLIEPNITLHLQNALWTCAFLLVAALHARLAWNSRTSPAFSKAAALKPSHSEEAAESETSETIATLRQKSLWFLLPMAAAMQLSAVTGFLSQNIAAIPLLWILPLAVYLLTFILAFDVPRIYRRGIVIRFLVVFLAALGYMLTKTDMSLPITMSIGFFLVELFIAGYFCHAEAHALRPQRTSEATLFYLLIAAGGVAGSFFIGIASPLLFDANYDIAISFAVTAACALLVMWKPEPGTNGLMPHPVNIWAQRALWSIATLLLCAVIGMMHTSYSRDSIIEIRNFYGSLRVRETQYPPQAKTVRTFLNGTIKHGMQWFAPEFRKTPTTYYAPDSGIGLALLHCCLSESGASRPKNIGVIGLGAGTLAAYGQPDDRITFYEINPAVEPIARNIFAYIRDSAAKVNVVEGDARISLQNQPPQNYDVVAVDAFSGDAIPLHLLTHEAMTLYKRHLAPKGILAFHVSNQYLNLTPEIARLADDAGMKAAVIQSPTNVDTGAFSSTWVLVTNNSEFLDQPEIAYKARPIQRQPNLRLWTDDYSSLLPILQTHK